MQGVVIFGAEKDFFAPITEDISLQAGGGFRTVIGSNSFKLDKRDKAFLFPVIFADAGFIQFL